MKLLIQTIFLIFILQLSAISGESGDLPEQEIKEDVEIMFGDSKKKEDSLDISEVEKLLEPKDNQIELPKNRLASIFGQYLLSELNVSKVNILGKCQKNLVEGKCFKVDPLKKSRHFNNYYFYTNEQNLVFAIIAFDNQIQSDLNKCKEKINMWENFFSNYDLDIKNIENNSLSFILSDAPQQNHLELFASCYTETYRDIKSSFSLKIYKNS